MLNKIDFHSKCIRSLLSITKNNNFLQTAVIVRKTTSIFICPHCAPVKGFRFLFENKLISKLCFVPEILDSLSHEPEIAHILMGF